MKKIISLIVAIGIIATGNISTVLADDTIKDYVPGEKNVNLILTKDTFGEFNLLEGNDDLLGLSTWFNERYVKEVSKKVTEMTKPKTQSSKK